MSDRVVVVREPNPPTVVEIQEPSPSRVVEIGAQGPPGLSPVLKREQPVGALNGSNRVFDTSSAYVAGTTLLYLNGLAQSVPDDYIELTTTSVQFAFAPLPGDALLIFYSEG